MNFLKIIFFTAVLLFFTPWVGATDDIKVSVSRENITLGENIELEIEYTQSWEIEIPGIENFSIFSQARSQRFQSVNGVTTQKWMLTLQLQAKQKGSFLLWPISFRTASGTIVDDDSFEIQVGEEKGDQKIGNENQKESGEFKNNSLDEQEENDIKDIRSLWFFWWYIILGALILFSAAYFALKKALENQDVNIVEANKEDWETVWELLSNIQIALADLEGNLEHLSSEAFFKELNHILRDDLGGKTQKDIKNMTLEELKTEDIFKKYPLREIFELSYVWEFSKQEYDLSERKMLLARIEKNLF